MRVIICSIALLSALDWTPAMAQSRRGGSGSGIMTGSRSSGGSGDHHHGGHGHNHGGHHHHHGGSFGGFYGGFRSFGFGGNVFYSASFPNYYYNSSFPYYGGGFYSSTTFYPPYNGGFFQYGTEVPITYLPMRGTTPAAPVNPAPLLNLPPDDPAVQIEPETVPADPELPPLDLADRPVRRSSLENRLRARQEQIDGDLSFREQDRLKAHGHYRNAAEYAEDLSSVQFRLAVSYAAQGKFDLAVERLKRVLELEPAWPSEGESISRLYGADNIIAQNALLIRVSQWVGEDIRDPDRLLLMGAFLFESSPDKAREFLRSSAQFSGSDRYAALFLNPIQVTAGKPSGEAPRTEESPLDSVIPAPPIPDTDDAPPARIVPPLPEKESVEERSQQESSDSTERFVPKDLGFTHPRHGGDDQSTASSSPVLEGPRFPVLGN